jgi:5'-3' exonuclease
MNRLNYTNEQEYVEEVWDDGFSSLGIDASNRENRVLIIDADTLAYYALYNPLPEGGQMELTEDSLEFLYGKISESVLKIFNSVEKYFNLVSIYIFIRGKNNFRKLEFDPYKSNRPPKHPLIDHLYNYLEVAHQAIPSYGAESDDYVYSVSKKISHTGIVAHVDADLDQIPGLHFNFQKNKFYYVTPKQSKFHLACKVLTGDSGDNVLVNKGFGIKKALKVINPDMTDYQYIKAIYEVYIKYNGDNAKKLLKQTYRLLKLHDIDELKNLNK